MAFLPKECPASSSAGLGGHFDESGLGREAVRRLGGDPDRARAQSAELA